MKPRFLLDENLNPAIKFGLIRLEPNIDIVYIGEDGVPSKGTLDPDILIWIETNSYILVTDNCKTMPTHISDHLAQNRRKMAGATAQSKPSNTTFATKKS